MGPAQICQQSQQHREQSLVQEDGMIAKRVAVSVLLLAVTAVWAPPAAALFGEPGGVYSVSETVGGSSINAHLVVLVHAGGAAVVELRSDGSWVGGGATASGASGGGLRLVGSLFTPQGASAGTFDLTVSAQDSVSGSISRAGQTVAVNGSKAFYSDGAFDGVYQIGRNFPSGGAANGAPEFIIVLTDKTRLADVATPIVIVYLAPDGRFYGGLDSAGIVHRAQSSTEGTLVDGFGQPVGLYAIDLTLDPLMLTGTMNIGPGVPSFGPGAYLLFGNRIL